MSFEEVNVNPQEVRFTQDSISRNLTQDYECSINENPNFSNGFSLDEIFKCTEKPSSVRVLCQQMEKGLIKPSDFPPIEVYKDEEGITWSNDNRRLWVFRKAGVTSVPAKLSSMPLFKAPPPPENERKCLAQTIFLWFVVGSHISFFTSYLLYGLTLGWSRMFGVFYIM